MDKNILIITDHYRNLMVITLKKMENHFTPAWMVTIKLAKCTRSGNTVGKWESLLIVAGEVNW